MERKLLSYKKVIFLLMVIILFSIYTGCGAKDYHKLTFYDKIKSGYSINVLINGDSIAQGDTAKDWSYLVKKHIQEKYGISADCYNISLGGNTTYCGYSRVNSVDFAQGNTFDLIILCYGQNDIDNDKFPQIYEALVRSSRTKYPYAQIITILESSQKEYTNKINKIIEISDYYKIPYVDMVSAYQQSEYSYDELSPDGIHPGDLGKVLYAENISETIDAVLEKRQSNKLPSKKLYDDSGKYDEFCYISTDSMDFDGNKYEVTISDQFDSIGFDRVLIPGTHAIEIIVNGISYDLGYKWDYSFSQRHIDELSIQLAQDTEKSIIIRCNADDLKSINGIILSGNKSFSRKSDSYEPNAITALEDLIAPEKVIEKTILNTEAKLHKAVDENDGTRNYAVYVYNVANEEYLNISSVAIGSINSITRYAFFEDSNFTQLNQAGATNVGGWEDSYNSVVKVPEGATYLLVTSQNGHTPVIQMSKKQEFIGDIRPIKVLEQHMLNKNGIVDDVTINETIKNYCVYIYDVQNLEKVQIKTWAIGNSNTICRFAYFKSIDDKEPIKNGSLNTNGWEDENTSSVNLNEELPYLFVTCQNGYVPIVSVLGE